LTVGVRGQVLGVRAKTRPDVLPETPVRPRIAFAPRWKVLLHNDDVHDMLYVIVSLRKAVPGLSAEEAAQIMLEAHLTGIGLVTVCPQEEAEYYEDRIKTFGLGASIEPEDG
jgi:ATP-dependent Clp protease adaptor protein ClpS